MSVVSSMASISVLTVPWKNEYPEFYDMMTKQLGRLEYVDEYDVPFWDGIDHVLIKPHMHPLFGKDAQGALMENAHAVCTNNETHTHVIKYTLDLFNEKRSSWLDDGISEEWKAPLAKSPIQLPKILYNQFKDSCRAVGKTASPVSRRMTVHVT